MRGERDFVDRVLDIERRVAVLEEVAESGLAGTDQTIKGSHDRLDNLCYVSTTGDNTGRDFTLQAWTAITETSTDVIVANGDIVLVMLALSWQNSVGRTAAGRFRLSIGGTTMCQATYANDEAASPKPITLVGTRTASGAATWTIRGECYVQTATDTITVNMQRMVIMRLRPATA